MKVALVFKSDKVNQDYISQIRERIISRGHILTDSKPEVVIFIGGDGTFLKAAHQYIDDVENIKFVGLCTGHLGFFFDYGQNDIDLLLDDLENNNLKIVKHRFLKAKVEEQVFYAVNEIRIESPFHSLISEVYIDNNYLETFRGNGLIVCSSIGSTAYNKSLSGAVVTPELDTLQLSEIAPINNVIYSSLHSPLVLSDKSKIVLKTKTDNILVGYDQFVSDSHSACSVEFSLSDKTISLLYKSDYSYIKLLNSKFIGKK